MALGTKENFFQKVDFVVKNAYVHSQNFRGSYILRNSKLLFQSMILSYQLPVYLSQSALSQAKFVKTMQHFMYSRIPSLSKIYNKLQFFNLDIKDNLSQSYYTSEINILNFITSSVCQQI